MSSFCWLLCISSFFVRYFICFIIKKYLFVRVACSERSASIASVGNSSLGAHSTVTIGNSVAAGSSTAADSYHGSATINARDNTSQHEYPSLTLFDDLPLEVLHEYETATGYGKLL